MHIIIKLYSLPACTLSQLLIRSLLCAVFFFDTSSKHPFISFDVHQGKSISIHISCSYLALIIIRFLPLNCGPAHRSRIIAYTNSSHYRQTPPTCYWACSVECGWSFTWILSWQQKERTSYTVSSRLLKMPKRKKAIGQQLRNTDLTRKEASKRMEAK